MFLITGLYGIFIVTDNHGRTPKVTGQHQTGNASLVVPLIYSSKGFRSFAVAVWVVEVRCNVVFMIHGVLCESEVHVMCF